MALLVQMQAVCPLLGTNLVFALAGSNDAAQVQRDLWVRTTEGGADSGSGTTCRPDPLHPTRLRPLGYPPPKVPNPVGSVP